MECFHWYTHKTLWSQWPYDTKYHKNLSAQSKQNRIYSMCHINEFSMNSKKKNGIVLLHLLTFQEQNQFNDHLRSQIWAGVTFCLCHWSKHSCVTSSLITCCVLIWLMIFLYIYQKNSHHLEKAEQPSPLKHIYIQWTTCIWCLY